MLLKPSLHAVYRKGPSRRSLNLKSTQRWISLQMVVALPCSIAQKDGRQLYDSRRGWSLL